MDGDYAVDDLGALLAVATANARNIEVGGSRMVAAALPVAGAGQPFRASMAFEQLVPSCRGARRAPLACGADSTLRVYVVSNPLKEGEAVRFCLLLQESRGLLGAFNWLGDRLLAAAHAARSNTLEGSRRNIEEHYDAGED
jgi:hypothetical protein